MRKLRQTGVLTLAAIRKTPLRDLEALIRSSGYFRQKALRLKLFVGFVDDRYGGSLNRMFAQSTENLRQELLKLNGIGPEPPTRYCYTQASIPYSSWMDTRAGF